MRQPARRRGSDRRKSSVLERRRESCWAAYADPLAQPRAAGQSIRDGARLWEASRLWQFFHEIREAAFPSERGAHRKVLWTNLVKFVTKDGSLLTMPYTEAEEAIQLQNDILTGELRIAKPEFCLFVTGPNFDCMLRRYFPGLRFVPLQTHERKAQLTEREFALLVYRQLPLHSNRTYHPGHLSRQKMLRKKVLQILSHQLAACQ